MDATHTPGNTTSLFIISEPGSYYLTTNITGVDNKDGIKIATNNVTLDLNGFSLIGDPTSSFAGIYIPFGFRDVAVRNGMVSGWNFNGSIGIGCLANHVTLERLTISSNGIGIYASADVVIKDCLIVGNEKYGINLQTSDSVVTGNSLLGNNAGNSASYAAIFVAGSNNRIDGNHITKSGVAGKGISISFSEGSYTNNLVIRNSVAGGGANNFSFGTFQVIGPIVTNTASGILTNSNPWANFSF